LQIINKQNAVVVSSHECVEREVKACTVKVDEQGSEVGAEIENVVGPTNETPV
jgi:hypothetical protein